MEPLIKYFHANMSFFKTVKEIFSKEIIINDEIDENLLRNHLLSPPFESF